MKREFLEKAAKAEKEHPKVFASVMAEFKEKSIVKISPESRRHFLTMIERRLPKPYLPRYEGKWRDNYPMGNAVKTPEETYGAVDKKYGLARG